MPTAASRAWLRSQAAKRFKKVENATAVIWKLLLIAERRFRRLNGAELLAEVWAGTKFVNAIRIKNDPGETAA